MKTLSLIFTLFVLTLMLSAQQNSDTCPTISITGPSGIVSPDELVAYTAHINLQGLRIAPTLKWTVNSGSVVSGQGTEKIEVRSPSPWTTIVQVEVEGFPVGCPHVASEKSGFTVDPAATKLAEIKGTLLPTQIFSNVSDAARQAPNAQLYIFLSGSSRNTSRSLQRKRTSIIKGLKELYDERRLTFVTLTNVEDKTVIWIVPPGVDRPTY